MECPTKLFYTGKEEYANNKLEDPFLEALAKGGFQVEQLAKAYYPKGQSVDSLNNEIALKETAELLKQDQCVIYEAAIKYENLFVRVDILVKEGDHIKLIEVKAKSADEKTADLFLRKNGQLKSGWKPYIYDVAFQNYVVKNALSEYRITPYLMLVDKNAKCPTDSLNQKFKISRGESGRQSVTLVAELTEADLSEKLLVTINTEAICRNIIDHEKFPFQDEPLDFADLVKVFSDFYQSDQRIDSNISSSCKNCEFKASDSDFAKGLKCGYRECFQKVLKWNDEDFADDTIFDLWDFRKVDSFIEEGKLKFANITKKDIDIKTTDQPGLTRTERQWIQIEKSVNKDNTYFIDKENLRKEMDQWTYPLHFIDFETAAPAIPFSKGRRPYSGIAFQFSHHIVHEDGTIEHKSEYLNTEIGVNPNIDFVRKLKEALDQDRGTIFRYSAHENTYLNMIYDELQNDSADIADRDELCRFIREITQYGSGKNRVKGPRNMVDLFELVKKYYYDPHMKGSNSIKAVLPAILNSSRHIQEKYSNPIYGAEDGIKSLNFKDWTWIQFEDGKVIDPYQLLPKLFADISDKDYEYIDLHEDINNGGAAMTAYDRLQFENIPTHIRKEVEKGLLKYCELDTLAMVLIYEAWVDMIYNHEQ